jgi:hypothetical protein
LLKFFREPRRARPSETVAKRKTAGARHRREAANQLERLGEASERHQKMPPAGLGGASRGRRDEDGRLLTADGGVLRSYS